MKQMPYIFYQLRQQIESLNDQLIAEKDTNKFQWQLNKDNELTQLNEKCASLVNANNILNHQYLNY